ncbi:hypothetical protein Tco_1570299 [Tanacetum coccineum]
MVISSPRLTNIKNGLVQSKRLLDLLLICGISDSEHQEQAKNEEGPTTGVNAARHKQYLLAETINVSLRHNGITAGCNYKPLWMGRKIINTESATIRIDHTSRRCEFIDCLPNAAIFEQLELMGNQQAGDMSNDKRIYVTPSHTNKVFRNMKREGKGCSGRITPLFPTMMTIYSDEVINKENVPRHSNDPLLSGEDRLKLEELMALCTNLQNMVLALEYTKTTQAQEIDSLKRRVNKLENKKRSRTHGLRRLYKVGLNARVISSKDRGLGEEDTSKQGRKIHDIDADEDITLENVHDEDMFDTNVFNGKEVFAGHDMAEKEVSTVDPAQTLAELKSVRPKTKGVVMQEPSETTTKIPSKDKGKGIMVKEPLKMKKKDQDKVETDYELAQRLQAEEQEELTIEEKSKLFQQLLEKRRKHFAAKRAEERRNGPPTKAQQRSIMTTYLKNMTGWKPEDLKNNCALSIIVIIILDEQNDSQHVVSEQVIDDGSVGFHSEVREEGSETREESSSKRAGDELEQEPSKKQKMEDDKQMVELQ